VSYKYSTSNLLIIVHEKSPAVKGKMKAINLIMQCYKEKYEVIKSEPELIELKRHMRDISIYDG
jgi:hypothetical protein